MPEWLPEIIKLEDFNGDWDNYLEALYNVYLHDFKHARPVFRGIQLSVKWHPLIKGKEATFWHIISEGEIEDERIPDIRRCERIPWPKPIIENSNENNIKVWQNKRKGDKIRICIYFEEIEYLVVIAKRKTKLIFWTSYPVIRRHTKSKLLKEYNEAKKAEDAII